MRSPTPALLGLAAACSDPSPATEAAREERIGACDIRVPADEPDLQAAVDGAPDGGTVCLAAGAFGGPLSLADRELVLAGSGPKRTVIEGNGVESTVIVVGGTVALSGLAIRGGGRYGVESDGADLALNQVVIADNTLGGLSVYASHVDLLDARVTRNGGTGISVSRASLEADRTAITANTGHGIYADIGDVVLRNSEILDNHTDRDGGGVWLDMDSEAELLNTVVAGNTAEGDGGGIGVDFWATASVQNCVVAGNTAVHGGGVALAGYYGEGAWATLRNTAVIANTATSGGGIWVGAPLGHETVSYSDLWGNVGGDYDGPGDPIGADGNVSVSPRFERFGGGSPGRWDFHLLPGSALIDAGDPALTDPDGSRSDIGAFGGPAAQ
jgi:hypothetical protein